MQKLGLCVVGCGQIAKRHFAAAMELEERVYIASTVDADPSVAKKAAETYGAPHWGTDYEEAFARPDVHAALLLLPNHLHAKATIAAAEAGLHILCEKPMALNGQEAEAMVAAAESADVTLMIGHSRRFHAAAQKARQLIAEGVLGRIRHMSSSLLVYIEAPSTPWRFSAAQTGGYLLPLLGVHHIDLLLWLTASTATEAFCTLSSAEAWEGEDEAAIILTLRSNGEAVPCNVLLSANCRMGADSRNEVVIAGTKGTLVLHPNRLVLNGSVVELPSAPQDFTAQLQEFLDSISEKRNPISSGREGLHTMEILDACFRSAREKVPVTLGK